MGPGYTTCGYGLLSRAKSRDLAHPPAQLHSEGVTSTQTQAADSQLPEFEQPPVVETAISVVFLPINGWKLSHFTRFARHVEDDYPDIEPQQRIIATPVEQFGPNTSPQTLMLEPGAGLWWYVNDEKGRLLQLQRDRFVHNWRKRSATDAYPRYIHTREEFRASWLAFLSFLKQEELTEPTVVQLEIDYINHIEKGAGWDQLSDIVKVTPLLAPPPRGFLPPPEAIQLNGRYLIPSNRGRLHLGLLPAIRNVDKVELLQLTLSARGRPAGSDVESIMAWCDLGHEWIVRGFVDVTTPDMHRIWRRTQ